jgi:hypothetical protein
MAFTKQQALDKATRLISLERAEKLVRLKHWQDGGCLSVRTRPDIADVTEEEDQALKAILMTLSGGNCWMDALYLVRNGHPEKKEGAR